LTGLGLYVVFYAASLRFFLPGVDFGSRISVLLAFTITWEIYKRGYIDVDGGNTSSLYSEVGLELVFLDRSKNAVKLIPDSDIRGCGGCYATRTV